MAQLKVLYINATIDERWGEVLRQDTHQRLAASAAAQKRGLHFDSYDMFYGAKQRPGNMGRFARENGYDAIVLSGSDKNTTDREDPWVQEYIRGLRDLLEVPATLNEWDGPPCPILGICFGHQALACALGGETARFRGKADVVELTTLSTAKRHPALRSLLQTNASRKIRAAVYHADQVVRMPEDFCPLFTSDYCTVQAMSHRDWPILSFQPHPEFGSAIMDLDGEKSDWLFENAKAELDGHDGPAILEGFLNWVATIR